MVTSGGATAGRSALRPEIDGERCVHGLCAQARCRVCVDVCPRAAMVLTETVLGFDEDACTGCGICRAACPEDAIAFPAVNFSGVIDTDARRALIACEASGVADGSGVVPCVHGAGERDLALLSGRGVRELVICRGACADCGNATTATLDAAVARFNRLAVERGQALVRLAEVSIRQFGALRSAAMAAGHDLDQKRRALFGGILAARKQSAAANAAVAGALARFVPSLDVGACSGCDACSRICPHDAIAYERAGGSRFYAVRADRCTGCRLCVDVCAEGAVAVLEMSRVVQTVVALTAFQCSKCGAAFHTPQPVAAGDGAESAQPVCPICRQTSHVSLLFQVRS